MPAFPQPLSIACSLKWKSGCFIYRLTLDGGRYSLDYCDRLMSVFQQGQKWHYAGTADRRKISTLSKQERKSKLLSAAARLPRSPPLFLHFSSERVYLLKPISCFITKHPVKFNKTPPLHCSVSNMLSKYGVFDEQKYKAWGNASDRALRGWISRDNDLNSFSVGEKRD